jgi:SAM-dependent methyltransferase
MGPYWPSSEPKLVRRHVCPEALDDLDPADPRAVRSRGDLRRVHRAMASLTILRNLIARLRLAATPKTILELGAGDGTLLLRLARTLASWRGVELTLLDRQRVVSPETLEGFRKLEWRVNMACEDALRWAAAPAETRFDLCVTTLFLHHFKDDDLGVLLGGIARRCDAFIASEPRRDLLAGVGSRLVGLLGTNAITRGDAVKSVAAGFSGRELSDAWPKGSSGWRLREFRAPPFFHCFLAARHEYGARLE